MYISIYVGICIHIYKYTYFKEYLNDFRHGLRQLRLGSLTMSNIYMRIFIHIWTHIDV